MRELPEGWTLETLGSAKVSLLDCDHKTPKAQESGYPYVGIPQLKDGRISLEGTRLISEGDFHLWRRKTKPSPNDIILSRRCNPGVTAYIPEGLEMALGQNLVLLRASGEKMYPPFLRWVTQGPVWWGQVRTFLNTGAVFESLKCADIPKFEIKLPPLPEQKAIADMLSSLDDKIELLREQNKTLETLAQTIFKEWFVHFNFLDPHGKPYRNNGGAMVASELGLIPKGWRAGSLLEVFDLIGGGTPKTSVYEYWNGDILWYSVVDAPKGCDTFVIDTEKKISDLGLQKSSTKLLRKGTTIVSARGTVGKLALVGCETAMNQSCYGIQGKGCFGDYYVYFQLKEALNSLKSRVHGAVFDTITQTTFKHIEVPIPDMDVAESFERIVKPTMDKILNNVFQIKTLSKTRDTLLPKLMSGQVRVQGVHGDS